jgi:hypothetical protein
MRYGYPDWRFSSPSRTGPVDLRVLIRIALRPHAATELRHTAQRESDGAAEYVVPGNVLRGSYLAMVSEGGA